MRICRKCNKAIPSKIEIEGKIRVLTSRKYCLECSPFGTSNRRQLEVKKICKLCNKEISSRRSICSACYAKRRRDRIRNSIIELVGEMCDRCGYGGQGYFRVLHFHHKDPNTKFFGLNASSTTTCAWNKVKEEISKCMLLCPNCHAEYHLGLW